MERLKCRSLVVTVLWVVLRLSACDSARVIVMMMITDLVVSLLRRLHVMTMMMKRRKRDLVVNLLRRLHVMMMRMRRKRKST